MSKETTLEERMQIIELSAQGYRDRQIAKLLDVSVDTVRKWRRRQRQAGRPGLASQMGRRKAGAMSSFPATIQQRILQWRKAHPGWGANTLHSELKVHESVMESKQPSPATIGRYLLEQGLTDAYEPHRELPQTAEQAAACPHDVWEMDARGAESVSGVGKVALIDVNDRRSHLRLISYPCWLGEQRVQRHPDTEDYQTVLRLAFTEWGRPQRVQVDHESVFYDNKSKSPFPTRFHLWLMALGIHLTFGRYNRPTDQALTERSHQLWFAQCLQGQHYPSWDALYLTLCRRRDFLNLHLPCASLGGQPPLLALPQAISSHRPYRPEAERALLDLQPIYDYLAQGRWFRLVSKDGTFSLGAQVYYIGTSYARQQLEITFDPTDQQLLCCAPTGQFIARLPIAGISVDALMGAMADFIHLPFFQFALPFDWHSQRVVRLFEHGGMTT